MRWLVIALILVSGFAWAQDAEAPEWLFDDGDAEDELALWSSVNQLDPLEIDQVEDAFGEQRSVLLTNSLGADPYFFPGGNWDNVDYEPFSGADYYTLYMAVRVNVAATWQIYYVTEEDTGWAEVQRQNFEVAALDGFEDIEVELERGGWQERTVLRFRIDPGTVAGVEAEIDYISFLGVPGGPKSVEPHGKLTTSWAQMRIGR